MEELSEKYMDWVEFAYRSATQIYFENLKDNMDIDATKQEVEALVQILFEDILRRYPYKKVVE